jgi:hypothetical protein
MTLDMDEPHEVNAVARKFTGSMTTATGQVQTVVRDLVPTHRPESELDRGLETVRHWMTNTIREAIPRADRRAEKASEHTEHTTGAIAAADTTGGNQVRRASI